MSTQDDIVETLRREGAALHDTAWGPVAVDFGDWQAEYRSFRRAAGLVRPPAVAQLEVSGRDRAAFLNRLATNKLDDIQPGEGRETFFADANGRILHHVFVFAGPDSLVLHTAAGLSRSLLAHLDHYWIREDLRFVDQSEAWGELVLAGPQAGEIVEKLAGFRFPRERAAEKPAGSMPSPATRPSEDSEAYLAVADVLWNNQPLMVRRFQQRDFQSFHLAGDTAAMEPLWRALRGLGAAACGARALETLRIEEGFPVIGLDITDKNLPQEIGRNAKAICFTKGCYLGQEIVARIDSRGAVSKVLCGLRFQSAEVPSGGSELARDGQPAGQITSAAFSPGFQTSVALGYVRRPFHEVGAVLASACGPATVVELPMR